MARDWGDTRERAILDACLERLRSRTGLQIEARPGPVEAKMRGPWSDATVRLFGPAATTDFAVEVKTRVRPSTIEPLVAAAHARTVSDPVRPLLCTEHVSAPVGKRLRDAGIAYLDTSGNAHVETSDVHVHVEGVAESAKPGRRPGRPDTSPLARPTGLCIVHELLRCPSLVHESTRVIAAAANVSQPSVARVLRELADEGWIRIVGNTRRARRFAELHRRWIDGYLDVLRPTLRPERMRPIGRDSNAALASVRETLGARFRAVYGGPMAAGHLGADLRSDEFTIHVPIENRAILAVEMQLRPDPNGPITVMDSIGDTTRMNEDLLVDALDVHAELLVEADSRLADAAEFVRLRYLEERWSDA